MIPFEMSNSPKPVTVSAEKFPAISVDSAHIYIFSVHRQQNFASNVNYPKDAQQRKWNVKEIPVKSAAYSHRT